MMLYSFLRSSLHHQHEMLQPLTGSLDASVLTTNFIEGKWSITEHTAHLMVYQKVFIQRLLKILSTENPSIQRYKAEEDPQFEHWRIKDQEAILTELFRDRSLIIKEVKAYSEAEFARKGIHPLYGNMSILHWIELFVLHESHHLFAIFHLIPRS